MPAEPSLGADVLPVIRSSGERTASRCAAILSSSLGVEPRTVCEAPFSAALRTTFELALDANAEWLMTIDADVLPAEERIASLVDLAHAVPENYYQVVGQIQDKLLHCARPGGIRLYRTSLLSKALAVLPRSNPVRPESGLYSLMAEQGHPLAMCNVITGHHDFEQFYRDVYRKSYFYAFKHASAVSQSSAAWRDWAAHDSDFRVALVGAAHGMMDPIRISDTDQFARLDVDEVLGSLSLAEKKPLLDLDILHLDALPPPRPVRWWTVPFPAKLMRQVSEYRRCGVPVTREFMKRALIAAANRADNSGANRFQYELPDLLA